MHLIAFTGPKYSGKDSAAKILLDQNAKWQLGRVPGAASPFVRVPFAGGVKSICAEMFGYTQEQMEDPVLKETETETFPFLAPRWPMMDIANYLRDKYGEDVHVERHKRQLLSLQGRHWAALTPDLRFPNEVDYLVRRKGLEAVIKGKTLIIYIQRDEAEQNLLQAQSSGDSMALNPSEAHYALLKQAADYVVPNNGPMHEMQNEVVSIVRKEIGFWGEFRG